MIEFPVENSLMMNELLEIPSLKISNLHFAVFFLQLQRSVNSLFLDWKSVIVKEHVVKKVSFYQHTVLKVHFLSQNNTFQGDLLSTDQGGLSFTDTKNSSFKFGQNLLFRQKVDILTQCEQIVGQRNKRSLLSLVRQAA